MKIAKLRHYKVKLWYRKYVAPDTNTKDITDSPVEEIIEQRSEETESSDRGEHGRQGEGGVPKLSDAEHILCSKFFLALS